MGKISRELEALYNTSFKQIHNWVDRFDKEGIDGLRDKYGRGRKPKLTPMQIQRLGELLDGESPTEHGYNIER